MIISNQEIIQAYSQYGSTRKAAEALGMAKSTFHDALQNARTEVYVEQKMAKPYIINLPKKGEVNRYILTSAQDGTKVHENFLENLEAYAEKRGAEILISGYTYNKNVFKTKDEEDIVYHESVVPYLIDKRTIIGDKLVFCAELNIIPTAVRPLSGLDTYTQDLDGIFPHSKIQLTSVPTIKSKPAKINMTTGTVTRPNYIQKKAGQKAEFHHVYGAVLVEINSDGTYFCRHLLGDEDNGSFYDLIYYVHNGKVEKQRGSTVASLTYGDIHVEKADVQACAMSFGQFEGSLLEYLKPDNQVLHDVTDFSARNHHNTKDPHHLFKYHFSKRESVEEELESTNLFMANISRPFTNTIVVDSNHHNALLRWLKEADYRKDPVNALFFLKCQSLAYKTIADKGDIKNIYADVLQKFFKNPLDKIIFLNKDDSYEICGIEHGMHGHKGANGARGSQNTFAKVASKVNSAHTHTASILDGAYCAGVLGSLDMGYNEGPSSWSHSNIITYQNGKRTIVTMRDGLFFL